MVSTSNNYASESVLTDIKERVKSENCTSSVKSDNHVLPNRPSSPRQFFERIYGHLETTNEHNSEKLSSDLSEISSSPDLCDLR